ncbi:MAG: ABC transporter permease [Bacillota bacterium]|nr:ABC transporter permease [Bacillota bacterium]
MKPLSSWNFYINNKRKVVPVVISLSIGVFLLYFMYIIGDSVIQTAEAGQPDTLSYFSILYPEEDTGIDSGVLEEIRQNENVERLIKVGYSETNIAFMGSQSSTMVLFMSKEDFTDFFDKMGLKLKEGNMPSSEDEIFMHWKIAANKGLKPGQYVGREVSDQEQLSGKFKISGTFDGPSQLSFVAVDSSKSDKYSCWMVQAKPGTIRQLNSFLKGIGYEKMGMITLNYIESMFDNNMQIVYAGSIFIEALVILVLCITVGNTTYLHFLQRKREFGILLAVGYRKKDMLKRISAEILYMSAASLSVGILLAVVVGFVIKLVYMDPVGMTIDLFNIKCILVTAILPASVFIISLLPAGRMIRKTDKINVIEGN